MLHYHFVHYIYFAHVQCECSLYSTIITAWLLGIMLFIIIRQSLSFKCLLLHKDFSKVYQYFLILLVLILTYSQLNVVCGWYWKLCLEVWRIMERTTLTITYEAFSPPNTIQLSVTEIVLPYFTWRERRLEMVIAITWATGIRSWDSCYYTTSSKGPNMRTRPGSPCVMLTPSM